MDIKAMEIKNDVYWVGALDPDLRIFDVIMQTPYGTTYNSYVIKGSEKTAIFETVKVQFFDQYLARLRSLQIDLDSIAYIIIEHTEPDHAGSVAKLLDYAKNAKIVGSAPAIRFLRQIANRDFESIVVKQGDTLSLGNKTLRFIDAPFLHWPDSIYTYVEEDRMLMTCDSFGCHYCNPEMFNDLNQNQEDYMGALKYYYDAIMGPFKSHVLKALERIKDFEIDYICNGHGPILRSNIKEVMELYRKWSTETAPTDGISRVTISYVSAYGFTEEIAKKISEGIKSKGNYEIHLFDIIHHKQEEILEKIYWSDGVLFGSPTINGDALEPVMELLIKLNPLVHGGKTAAAFGSFGWSGEAVPNIEGRLKQLRMKLLTPGLKINFKPSEEELLNAFKFGQSFAEKIQENLNRGVKPEKRSTLKKWKCIVCGEVFEGTKPPEVCPACGATEESFIEVKLEEITFQSDKKEKYVLIGNGAASYYAADAIRKRNSSCDIEIISEENTLTYYKPQLSDYLSEELKNETFYVAPESWYTENHIKLTLNTRVEDIHTDKKVVVLKDGKEISYDKLILANGASNFIPDLPGTEKQGVFTLRNLEDAKKVKSAMSKIKKAVIIGGGLLGLEAAWEMHQGGIDVTVIEMFPRLLPMQLDENGAQIFRRIVAESGINVVLDAITQEILGNEAVTSVKLTDGSVIDADLVLFSVGIRPNKDIAEKAGLTVNKGVVVNERMETSVKDVYACGDVAELNEKIYGNWPAAIEMGRVAGTTAVGDQTAFASFISSVVFNAMNTEIFSCGDISGDSVLEYSQPDIKIYKKLFFKNNKLVGGILLGDTKKSVKVMEGILQGKTPAKMLEEAVLL